MRKIILITALLLGACTSTEETSTRPEPEDFDAVSDDSPKDEMDSWIDRSLPVIDEFSAIFARIGSAAGSYDVATMQDACYDLVSHVSKARNITLPTPLADLTSELELSYSYHERAAQNCIAGAETMNADLLNESVRLTNIATQHTANATQIINDYAENL